MSAKYFGIVLFMLIFLQSPGCDQLDVDVTKLFLNAALNQSKDPSVRAAGETTEKDKKAQEARDGEAKSFNEANLAKGKAMDFTGIDTALKAQPGDSLLYNSKAVMQVAAGQDPAQTVGQGVYALTDDNKKRYGSANPDEMSDAFTMQYANTLKSVSGWNLPADQKANLQREYCRQALLVQTRSTVAGSYMAKDLAVGPGSFVKEIINGLAGCPAP